MGPPTTDHPPVILFGYDSSPFTNKVRLALRLKGIPFTYIPVPSMMPRPLLHNTFGVTYRKIPILALGRELYCDTSLIIEALEHYFPSTDGWGSVYPPAEGLQNEWIYRGLARGFASFWIDRPFFRSTTGLIPPSVWRTSFGTDRAALIGHALDPEKLAKKIPENLSRLDLHLSLLEPMLSGGRSGSISAASKEEEDTAWLLPTRKPSLADLSLYYQLRWGCDIAAGRGIYNLTGGGTGDRGEDIVSGVFNEERYPGVWKWFHAFEAYIASLPDRETTVDDEKDSSWKQALKDAKPLADDEMLVPATAPHPSLDRQRGLVAGAMVSVAPDDTGRNDPTVGKLVKIGTEEVVIQPKERGEVDVRIHFPRLGFVVRGVEESRL